MEKPSTFIAKKIKRNICILCKILNDVNLVVLFNLYYVLVYFFLAYGLISWR